ncbi:MAG: hypothetical protein IMZ43_01565 [Thermoplasmata archaeon]|nr:hypothetical protein [Thermoplasmata archaeon]
MDELEKENSERIAQLKSWINIYQDNQNKSRALAVLGERQYLAIKYVEFRSNKGGEQ